MPVFRQIGHTAHLQKRNKPSSSLLEYGLNIAGHGESRGQLYFSIQHLQDLLELGVVHDGEGTVSARTPQRQHETEARRGVRHTVGVRGDELDLGNLLWIAAVDVALQVARGIFIVGVIDVS